MTAPWRQLAPFAELPPHSGMLRPLEATMARTMNSYEGYDRDEGHHNQGVREDLDELVSRPCPYLGELETDADGIARRDQDDGYHEGEHRQRCQLRAISRLELEVY